MSIAALTALKSMNDDEGINTPVYSVVRNYCGSEMNRSWERDYSSGNCLRDVNICRFRQEIRDERFRILGGFSACLRREARTTEVPRFENSMAVARPMPLDAPVMTAMGATLNPLVNDCETDAIQA